MIGDPIFDEWLSSEMSLAARVLTSSGARVLWLNAPCLGRGRFGAMGVYEPWRTRRYNEILVESAGALPFDSLEVVDFFGIVCPRGEYTN